ncbi:MAG TPA: RHS repeat-associated core domain-containing protein [Ktedonobacterales bacterium]|nr:RHS repeat-associated core domain-containing protein [Ktedonobacterales bacterium]
MVEIDHTIIERHEDHILSGGGWVSRCVAGAGVIARRRARFHSIAYRARRAMRRQFERSGKNCAALSGAARMLCSAYPTSKGYTGQRADATTSGLDDYGARYYDAVAGQFTSADTLLPLSAAQPDPGQLNRYAYVAGNPETKTDPSGHVRVRPTGRGGPFQDPNPRPYDNPLPSSVDSCYLNGGCFIDHRNKRSDPPEHEDGYVLAKYFGLHGVRPRKQNIFGQPDPDYIMFPQIDEAMPGVAAFGQGPKLAMDLYTPANGTVLMGSDPNDPHLRGVANTIYEKSEQASIVVVDLRNIDPHDMLTKDEVNLAAAQAVYAQASGLTHPSQVVRVLFIRDGVVWDDYNPLDYGPAPAPQGGMPILQD